MHKLILVFYIPRFEQTWALQTLRAMCVVGGGGDLVVRYGPLMVGRMMVIVWLLLGQKVLVII